MRHPPARRRMRRRRRRTAARARRAHAHCVRMPGRSPSPAATMGDNLHEQLGVTPPAWMQAGLSQMGSMPADQAIRECTFQVSASNPVPSHTTMKSGNPCHSAARSHTLRVGAAESTGRSGKGSIPAGAARGQLGVAPPPRMHPTEGSIFVTVGTTSFDALIAMVDSEPFARLLQMMGYGTLVVQYGELGSPT